MGWFGLLRASRATSLFLFLTFGALGCGGKADANGANSTGGTGGQPASGGGNVTTTGGVTGGSPTGGTTGGVPPLENAFGCPGIPGSLLPGPAEQTCGSQRECDCGGSDYYFLIERSAKMLEPWGNTTRWQFMTEALSEFGTPFGRGGIAFSGALDTGVGSDTCDPANYAAPTMLFGDGVGLTPPLAEILPLAAPAGGNPMLPAFEGLVAFAKQRNPSLPLGWFALVLLTASAPDECPSDGASEALARAVAASGLPTAVIALDANYDVDPLARASGALPFRIGVGDAPSRLVEALRRVLFGLPPIDAEGTPSCLSTEIANPPPGRRNDLDTLAVSIETSSGSEILPRVSGLAACATSPNGGFYLNPRQSPPTIELCPCSCARISMLNLRVQLSCPGL